MRYADYTSIPYPFLHDAALVISKRYTLESIYMDNQGELCITLKGTLDEKEIKDILKNLNPVDSTDEDYDLEYSLNYSYSDDMQKTYIYSLDKVDYRTLL